MRRVLAFAILLSLTACQRGSPQPASSNPEAISEAFDETVRRAGLAFRERDGELSAGGEAHRVAVGPSGAVRFSAGEGVRHSSPLTLTTRRMGRGWSRGELPEARASASAEGSVVIVRPEARELLANTERGLEQSFSFERRPSGEGDLVIEIEAEGLSFVGQTETGLHFGDQETGLGVRYGLARWVDAKGLDRALPAPTFEGGRILLRVPEALLAASPYPAVLDPIVSAEQGIDQPVYEAAVPDRRFAKVVFDGSAYLTLWDFCQSLIATRVNAAGELVEPGGEQISRLNLTFAAAASNGSVTLVLYGDGSLLRATRFDSSGHALEGYGTSVTRNVPTAASIASSNDGFLAVWARDDGLWGARFGADGSILEPAPFELAPGPNKLPPLIASDGTSYLVAWNEIDNGTFVSVLDSSGSLSQPRHFPDVQASALAFGAGEYLLVFPSYQNPSYSDLSAIRLSPEGAPLGRSLVAGSADMTSERDPVALFDGANFAVAFNAEDHLHGGAECRLARVRPDGTAADSILIDRGWRSAAWDFASGPAGYLFVWAQGQSLQKPLLGKRVLFDGTVLDPDGFAISMSANDQRSPAVGASASSFLVAWHDSRISLPTPSIIGARVGADGTVLDPAGLLLIELPTGIGAQGEPTIASNGTGFLVAYPSSAGTLVRTVSPTGALSPAVLSLSPSMPGAAGAWAGGSYWMAGKSSAGATLVKLDENGSLQASLPLPIQASACCGLSSLGDSLFLFWDDPTSQLRVAAVGSDGTLSPAAGSVIASDCYYRPEPGAGAFLVQCNDRFLLTHVGEDGTVLSTSPVGLTAPDSRLSFDGQSFLIAWKTNGLRVVRVAPDGMVRQEGAIEPFPTAGTLDTASLTTGVTLLAQSKFKSGDLRSWRVRIRLLTETPDASLGYPCWDGLDCQSGFCADGVCCDQACGDSDGSDCLACSVAAGAAVDGTCAPAVAGHVCRIAAGVCDVAEACDGSSIACPPDAVRSPGEVCRREASVCDVPELCTGDSAQCPADLGGNVGTLCRPGQGICDIEERCSGAPWCPSDQPANAGAVCRESRGACDPAESCSGSSPLCPRDQRFGPDRVCRPATGDCDAPEACSGSADDCPDDQAADDRTFCGTVDRCTVHQCRSGQCVAFAAECYLLDCQEVIGCDPEAGCIYSQMPDGAECDGGTCQAGICQPLPDAGPSQDAGSTPEDAGLDPDAGVSDRDAGTLTAPAEPSGCGCAAGPVGSNGATGLLSILVIALARRRR